MFPFIKVITVIWVVFWAYWLISAFGSKRNSKSNIKQLKQFIGARLILVAVAAILATGVNHRPYSFQNRLVTSSELVLTLGFIIFLAGLSLAVWARIYLGKNWGMPMTEKQDPELVTSGPYRYIRHPIYTGILLAALGSTVDISIYWLVVFVIAGAYFIYSAIVEEKLMLKQFPKVYPPYMKKTKMLIPFIF